jgi:hypothetical protein
MNVELSNGWAVKFAKNVHMYSHSLEVSKGRWWYAITCEDLPMTGGVIGMWLYELNLDEEARRNLLKGLVDWAGARGIKYRIYISRENYETNEKRP